MSSLALVLSGMTQHIMEMCCTCSWYVFSSCPTLLFICHLFCISVMVRLYI